MHASLAKPNHRRAMWLRLTLGSALLAIAWLRWRGWRLHEYREAVLSRYDYVLHSLPSTPSTHLIVVVNGFLGHSTGNRALVRYFVREAAARGEAVTAARLQVSPLLVGANSYALGLEHAAQTLYTKVNALCEVNPTIERISFAATSFGGLVTRRCATLLRLRAHDDDDGDHRVGAGGADRRSLRAGFFLTFSTPWMGVTWERRHVYPFYRRWLLRAASYVLPCLRALLLNDDAERPSVVTQLVDEHHVLALAAFRVRIGVGAVHDRTVNVHGATLRRFRMRTPAPKPWAGEDADRARRRPSRVLHVHAHEPDRDVCDDGHGVVEPPNGASWFADQTHATLMREALTRLRSLSWVWIVTSGDHRGVSKPQVSDAVLDRVTQAIHERQ